MLSFVPGADVSPKRACMQQCIEKQCEVITQTQTYKFGGTHHVRDIQGLAACNESPIEGPRRRQQNALHGGMCCYQTQTAKTMRFGSNQCWTRRSAHALKQHNWIVLLFVQCRWIRIRFRASLDIHSGSKHMRTHVCDGSHKSAFGLKIRLGYDSCRTKT